MGEHFAKDRYRFHRINCNFMACCRSHCLFFWFPVSFFYNSGPGNKGRDLHDIKQKNCKNVIISSGVCLRINNISVYIAIYLWTHTSTHALKCMGNYLQLPKCWWTPISLGKIWWNFQCDFFVVIEFFVIIECCVLMCMLRYYVNVVFVCVCWGIMWMFVFL